MSVIGSLPGIWSQVTRVAEDGDPYAIAASLDGVDVIVAEGFKDSSAPNVLVYKNGRDAPNCGGRDRYGRQWRVVEVDAARLLTGRSRHAGRSGRGGGVRAVS